MKNTKIIPYDTTLRDGAQDPRARLSVAKKLAIAKRLDKWGMPYIEGGWPGANEIDTEFFQEAKGLFQHSQLVAFGMTARIGVKPENDAGLNMLLKSETKVVTLVGKTWLQNVKLTLRTEGLPNLETIRKSIEFLTKEGREVFFDAEHWFDGFSQDPQYAMAALEAAKESGAAALALCDTRGSCTPEFIYRATRFAKKRFPDMQFGIHAHNDGGLAVINSVWAVKAGVTQVQGTINGVGERTGNVDLCVVLPTAEFKYGLKSGLDMQQVFDVAHFVAKQNEIPVPANNPYTGKNAFRHKAGLHAAGQQRDPESYQHIDPNLVGNTISFVQSEQGGSTNVEIMAKKHGFDLSRNNPAFTRLVEEMKKLKVLGDAQEFLLLHKFLGSEVEPFDVLVGSRVTDTRGQPPEAYVKVRVNGSIHEETAFGDGPINAFDLGLKAALLQKYPQVKDILVDDYTVSLPQTGGGSAAEVEVYVRLKAGGTTWTSRVRGTDQQRTGEDALIQGYKYYLLKQI
ncbi:citramalate synthase [Candidatus Daviesbacteria bacterium]|nr:citramalate synthase [Candidatus Daviesbacteria bacterium]